MNSENSQTSKHHVLILNLSDKMNLRRAAKSIVLSNLSIYYTWNNIKKPYNNNNKFKISAPTWTDKFEMPDGSCSTSDIQEYFDYIFKKYGENIDNSSIKIYVNKTENRNTIKIKTRYYLELLTPETTKLLESKEKKIIKDKNGKNVPHSQMTETVLVHCNIIKKIR